MVELSIEGDNNLVYWTCDLVSLVRFVFRIGCIKEEELLDLFRLPRSLKEICGRVESMVESVLGFD